MTTMWWIVAGGFLLNIAIGLGFVTRRKGGAESLLAALLFGTAGVALTLVLSEAVNQERAVDLALVFALLAAVLGVTFVQRAWSDPERKEDYDQ
jgi:multicomponent Na+:H+ antiporter subunit F